MDYALPVRVRECVCDVARDVARHIPRELFLAIDSMTQCFAADIWHHVVEQSLNVPRIVKRKDVGMLESSEEPNLANEAKLAGIRCRISVKDLDRDFSFVLEIARQIYGSEGSLAYLTLDIVMAAKCSAERRDRVWRRSER